MKNVDKLKVGMVVKMNPFTLDEAIRQSCSLFEGESTIQSWDGMSGKVKASNYWQRKCLLVKGVDYDE